MNNSDFFSDYKRFTEKLITKGYSRMTNKEAPVGRT